MRCQAAALVCLAISTIPNYAIAQNLADSTEGDGTPEVEVPTRFVMTVGLSVLRQLLYWDNSTSRPAVEGRVGAEVLDGHLDLFGIASFGWNEAEFTNTEGERDSADEYDWSVGFESQYNFTQPLAGNMVPSLMAGVYAGQRKRRTVIFDDSLGTVPENQREQNVLGARVGAGLEYMFTDELSLGARFNVNYSQAIGTGSGATDERELGTDITLDLGFRY